MTVAHYFKVISYRYEVFNSVDSFPLCYCRTVKDSKW